MSKEKTINNIPSKEADTNIERMLLGYISVEASHLGFGKLFFEINVHNGKMTNVQSQPSKRSFNLNAE